MYLWTQKESQWLFNLVLVESLSDRRKNVHFSLQCHTQYSITMFDISKPLLQYLFFVILLKVLKNLFFYFVKEINIAIT